MTGGAAPAGGAGWLRAAGLVAATTVPWVGNPLVLIALPFGLLALFKPGGRPLLPVLAVLAVALAFLGDTGSGFWYLERGWALLLGGCFLALTLRWPGGTFLPKGLGAVFGAFLGMALLFRARPGEWSLVEWLVRGRMELAMSSVLQAVRLNVGPDAVPLEVEAQALEAVALQGWVFPALLGLASLAGLGVAWFLYKRISRSPEQAIRPLREFRFNDQLVWVLILGVTALLLTSGVLERIGINAVVFMGALYAVRGAAVVLFLTGGLSILGLILLLVGFFLLAPLLVGGALFIGLGDTWFDLRRRGASTRSGDRENEDQGLK